MNHKDLLAQSVTALRSRSEQYGSEEDVMNRACKIFENITGIEMSLYEGAIFLHSYEMARIQKSRRNMASVLNGINYLALSAQFSTAEHDSNMDNVKEMAAKLSPMMRQAPPPIPQVKEGEK